MSPGVTEILIYLLASDDDSLKGQVKEVVAQKILKYKRPIIKHLRWSSEAKSRCENNQY
jgi:hypothetical protein